MYTDRVPLYILGNSLFQWFSGQTWSRKKINAIFPSKDLPYHGGERVTQFCLRDRTMVHPAGSSNDSDKWDFKQRFWHDVNGQWENYILKYLKEMKKYVSKLILHTNIIKYDDPNYVGTFQQYTGRERLIRSHSSASFRLELSGNLN